MTMIQKIIAEITNTGERPIVKNKFEEIDPVFRFVYELASKEKKLKNSYYFSI